MAAITHYDQGDVWTPQATFTVSGTPTDPTTLVVRIKSPDGVVTTITENTPATPTLPIVRVSAGVFKHSGIALNDAGYWFVRFEGTGTAAAAEEHQAIVDPSEFYESAQLGTRSLVSLAEAKDWLNIQNIDTSNDFEIARVIVDVSDRFHREAQREFKAITTGSSTRYFDVERLGQRRPWYVDGVYMGELSPGARLLRIGDAVTITAVQILDQDWTTVVDTLVEADWTELPQTREAWEPIRQLLLHQDVPPLELGYRVAVTGTWGFPAVPGNVRQAVLDGVASVLDRDVEHYRQDLGAVGSSEGQGGNVIMVGGGGQRMLSLPPVALAVAWDYRDNNIG